MPVRTVSGEQGQTPLLIPKLVSDPVASFQPWDIDVTFAGHCGVIPAMSAAEWLSVLIRMEDDLFLDTIFPDLLESEDQQVANSCLIDGTLGIGEAQDVALQIITSAAGRPWWVALRLIASVTQNWDSLGGEFVYRGVNPSNLSLAGWLDAAQTVIIRGISDTTKANIFLMRLEEPPPGIEVQDEGVDAQTFMSMM